MAEEVTVQDVFPQSDLEDIRKSIGDIVERFAIHTHDGRNSLPIDVFANARKIRLATLNQISDGSDGNVTISGNTTLTRDMFYDVLTIENGGALTTASFKVFANQVEIKSGGVIKNNGNAGGNGGDGGNATAGAGVATQGVGLGGSAGSAGAAIASGSMSGSEDGKVGVAGVDGKSGGAGDQGPGNNGNNGPTDGDSITKGLGAAGVGGSAAGAGGDVPGTGTVGGTGGNGKNGGSISGTVFNIPRSFISAYQLVDFLPSQAILTCSAGSGSSGSGGTGAFKSSSANVTGGGSGGSGGSGGAGGMVAIYAKQIINNGTISANGGNGGNAGATGTSWSAGAALNSNIGGAGGSGGGAGGSGGVVILVYGDISGSGTISVAGGTGGTKSNKALGYIDGVLNASADGHDGVVGTNGLAGVTYSIKISSL